TLDRLRRIQQRRRRPGRRIPLPHADAAGRERAARAGADPDAATFLGLGLRAMAAGLEEGDLEAPEVLGVELGPRQLEVVLAEPSTWAPPWFTAHAGGSRWVLDRRQVDAELEDLVVGIAAPLPALVTVGRKDDDDLVLVDLEAGGCTCVVGDQEATKEVVLAAAMELANKADGELFSLVLVGFGQDMSHLERVQVVDSAGEVIDRLEREVAERAQALEDSGWETPLVARVRGVADSWAPTVVCCVEPPPPPLRDRLAALAGNAGVGVLVAGAIEAAPWQLALSGDELDAAPLGVVVTPQRLADDEAADIGEFLAVASSTEDEAPDEESPEEEEPFLEDDVLAESWVGGEGGADDGEVPERPQAAGEEGEAGLGGEEPSAPERPEVLVRVLGPVEIEGASEPAARTKAVEAVAYLATHRASPADGLRLRQALWPREAASKKSIDKLNHVMWDARKMLGSASNGSEHLPTLKGGNRYYELNRTVGTDYDLFMDRARRARAQVQQAVAIALLKEALELVRGQPFEATRRGYGWAHDRVSWEMTAQVSDAAHWLSRMCFEAGDYEGARWAASQGLRASPWDRQLLKVLLAAEKALGGNARLKALMEDLEMASEDQDEDGVDIEVVRTFEELLRQQEPERALRVVPGSG
nr:hypothetical protein [Actinomycetota bacterium]